MVPSGAAERQRQMNTEMTSGGLRDRVERPVAPLECQAPHGHAFCQDVKAEGDRIVSSREALSASEEVEVEFSFRKHRSRTPLIFLVVLVFLLNSM